MEKDIGYKFLKSINLCFIYIQFFHLMERIKSDPELCERLGIESAEEEVRKASEKTLQK